MSTWQSRSIVGALVLATVASACSYGAAEMTGRERLRVLRKLGTRNDLPTDRRGNWAANVPKAARFGQFLFFSKELSSNGKVACASCHLPERAFTDGEARSPGVRCPEDAGPTDPCRAPRNTPTVLNAAYRDFFFWDGRIDSLWAQGLQPFENPLEMGTNRTRIAHQIHDRPELREAYEAIFGEMPDLSDPGRFPPDAMPVHASMVQAFPEIEPWKAAWQSMRADDRKTIDVIFSNVGKCLDAYQRRLVSRRSDFDAFFEGLADKDETQMNRAMNASAQKGLRLFVTKARCWRCHDGPDFTDEEFHFLGLGPHPWFDDPPTDTLWHDGARHLVDNPFNCLGPYSGRCDEAAKRRVRLSRAAHGVRLTKGRARTPGLRDVSETAPYMHGGHFGSLEEVIEFYNRPASVHPPTFPTKRIERQRDRRLRKDLGLDAGERKALVDFLKALRGEPLPPQLLCAPAEPLGEPRCASSTSTAEASLSPELEPCTTTSFAFPELEEACATGGRDAAIALMWEIVADAEAAGETLQCSDCHVDTSTSFDRRAGAEDRLRGLLTSE